MHAPFLNLPYFWDEAGYYIPAARDFFLHGDLVPVSTLSSAHPPLLMMYLALAWKLFGYSPLVTRTAMLLVASFALAQVYRLAECLAGRHVAWATTICFAVYPVFFAQSALAHSDLPATALTLLGLRLYFGGAKRWLSVAAFALATLAKEIAIITPFALAAWELMSLAIGVWLSRKLKLDSPKPSLPHLMKSEAFANAQILMLSAVPLVFWFAYHYHYSGYMFGNPEYFRYNVASTITPARIAMAALQRIWQILGYMNLWVLTLLAASAMLLPPLQDNGVIRPRIAIPVQLALLAVVLAHVLFHSLIGGAELARYLMGPVALVIMVAVSTLRRRLRQWRWGVVFVCVTFITGWIINPPFRFSPEDNLAYADFVRLHQQAASFIASRYPNSRVLTAWPASDELSHPYIGYVDKPIRVVRIENFSLEQITLAQQRDDYDTALIFSTKYEPPRRLINWDFWEKGNARFFDYHRDLSAEAAAQMLGGTVVMQDRRKGQWVAVLEFQRAKNAKAFAIGGFD